MTAEEYLSQIQTLDEIINSKSEKLKDLNDQILSLGGFSISERVQASRNLQRSQTQMAKYIDLEREIEKLKNKRESIIEDIKKLPTVEFKTIYRFYVKNISLKVIACQLGYSYVAVKKIKQRALIKIQKMIDEKNT